MSILRKKSLSFRIITRVLSFTVFLFLIILLVFYLYARSDIRKASSQIAINLGDNTVGKIEEILQPMEKIPQMIAALLETQPIHHDSLFSIVAAVVKNNPAVYGAAIAFEPDFFPHKGRYFSPYAYRSDNQVLTMQLGGPHYEYFFMDWYQIPKLLQKTYWTEPYYDEGGGDELMATYSVPFYSRKNGERVFAGIATVDLDLQWLTDIVSEVKIFDSGYAFMVSQNGVALTHPDRSMIMNNSLYSNAEEWGAPILREIGRDLRQGISRFREYQLPGRDKQWIYYRNLNSNQWAVSLVFPDSEMYASLHNMTTILIILFMAGMILLILITGGVVNRLASPLDHFAHSARLIAEGNFNVKFPEVKTLEMMELKQAFNHMQKELDRYVADLQETTSAKEKIESELRIAREIQLAMIPHTFPPFPDLPEVDLHAILRSARDVGGDLYDFFQLDGRKFCFAIGDVSGKGVPASLFMAVTRTLLRSISDKAKTADGIMSALNKSLAFNNESNMFVTFFLGILDLETGILSFANAGHNPPVLIRANGSIEVFETAKAIPLGLFESVPFVTREVKISCGDKIFAYTDGVSEAENHSRELFGEERMLNLIKENTQKHPSEITSLMIEGIDSFVNHFPQSDDITMMTIQYNGKA